MESKQCRAEDNSTAVVICGSMSTLSHPTPAYPKVKHWFMWAPSAAACLVSTTDLGRMFHQSPMVGYHTPPFTVRSSRCDWTAFLQDIIDGPGFSGPQAVMHDS